MPGLQHALVAACDQNRNCGWRSAVTSQSRPRGKLPLCWDCPPLPCSAGAHHLPSASVSWHFSLQLKPRQPGTGRPLGLAAVYAPRKHSLQPRPGSWNTALLRRILRIPEPRLLLCPTSPSRCRRYVSPSWPGAKFPSVIFRGSLLPVFRFPASSALRLSSNAQSLTI